MSGSWLPRHPTTVEYCDKYTYVDLAYFGGHRRHNLPPLRPAQPVIADEEIICWGTLNLFVFFVPGTCMRRPGWYPQAWSSWHLQVVSLHLISWTSLSASFAFCSILPCESERSGRRKPPAERVYIIPGIITTIYPICTNLIFWTFTRLFPPPVGLFLALSAAGHAGGPPVHHGASWGPGRDALRVIWAFKVVRSGK